MRSSTVLGPEEGRIFAGVYDVTPDGNFEGHTILNRLSSLPLRADADEQRLAAARTKLLEARSKRVRPSWDDKVLADWNGLMIAALARASLIFDKPHWLKLAERAFDFVATRMTRDGRLQHAWRAGIAKAPATASDYANMIWGALRLHEATGEQRYFEHARAWTETLDRHYWIDPAGGYATSADDTRDVIVRCAPAATTRRPTPMQSSSPIWSRSAC